VQNSGQTAFSRSSRFILCLLILIISTFAFACEARTYPEDQEQLSTDERIVIRFSHVVGEETPKGMASRRFAELVEERTDGYVEVQVFPNSFLYKDGEELDALLAGDVQMIAPSTSKVTGLQSEWQVFDLPYAFRDFKEIQQYLGSPVGERMQDGLKQEGMVPLAFWDNGFKQMTNNRHDLIQPADFQGLRFRIMSSEVLEEQFAVLQASSRVDTFDQVFPLLEQGEIDGQENTFSNIVNRNIYDLQDYMTISNHGYLFYTVLINEAFWEELPAHIQETIREVMEEVTEWEMELAQEMNAQDRAFLESCQCVSVYELNEAERQMWEEALQPLYESYEKRFGASYIEHLPKNKSNVGVQ
jgi:tripartite ATP-independent transporter DctP family solute receptor